MTLHTRTCLKGINLQKSVACEHWLTIVQCPDLKLQEKKLKHRFKQAMTPHHFPANLLHPVYRGSKLLPDHVNAAHEFLPETSPDLLPELLSFMKFMSDSVITYSITQ